MIWLGCREIFHDDTRPEKHTPLSIVLLLLGKINQLFGSPNLIDERNLKPAFLSRFSNRSFLGRFIGLLTAARQETAAWSDDGGNLATSPANDRIPAWAQMILCIGLELSKFGDGRGHRH